MNAKTSTLLVATLTACSHAGPTARQTTRPAASAEAAAAGGAQSTTAPDTRTAADPDPYLWLEEVDGSRAMAWVEKQSAATLADLGKDPAFTQVRDGIREVLDSKEKIPFVTRQGDYLYNFWTDAEHPRGLWRRTTLAEYRKAQPSWQILLDIDALGAAEHQSWVWKGAVCKRPAWRRCLVQLSRGGADAKVVREFDVEQRRFVPDGFTLPEAKSDVAWLDDDTLYVATDFGPGSMTTSGYPRIVKIWKRGTPLAKAELVYEAKRTDMVASGWRDLTAGFERDFVQRQIDFWNSETFLRRPDGKLQKLEVPLNAVVDVHREWLTIRLRSPWTVDGTTYPAGALLAAPFDDFLAGKRRLTMIFEPDASTSLAGADWTRHHLILNEMHDVVSRIEVLTPREGAWRREPLGGAPALATLSARSTDPESSDAYFLVSTGFLQPTTLSRGVLDESEAEVLKRTPAFFDAAGKTVHQYFARSDDGTRVPYFVISAEDMPADGNNPTILYGYGGFEVSLQPFYSGAVGRAWLARGGVFVVANIRGGGEYGPRWHEAALAAHRLLAYQDFAAVARDLFARKITSPAHLAAQGGSNGGLLVGNMLTLYPELFGAIVCEVPLLDMKRYTHIAAGASWIAEYGDPDDPEQWTFIHTFSPYQNVRPGTKYPPVLFTTTTRDDRVGPQHARKMAAKMLDFGDDVLFYENTEGGHGFGADSTQRARMEALQYVFMWDHVRRAAAGGVGAAER